MYSAITKVKNANYIFKKKKNSSTKLTHWRIAKSQIFYPALFWNQFEWEFYFLDFKIYYNIKQLNFLAPLTLYLPTSLLNLRTTSPGNEIWSSFLKIFQYIDSFQYNKTLANSFHPVTWYCRLGVWRNYSKFGRGLASHFQINWNN